MLYVGDAWVLCTKYHTACYFQSPGWKGNVKVSISLALFRATYLCMPLCILYISTSYRAIYRIYTYIQWACCRGHDSTWHYFWMIKSHILPFWRNSSCFPLCWDLFYTMHIFYNWNAPIFFPLLSSPSISLCSM